MPKIENNTPICSKCKNKGYTESTPLDEFSFRYWVKYDKTQCECIAGIRWKASK